MATENKKGNKFKIADPAIQLSALLQSQSKYNIGEKGYNFFDIKHLKPTFAFDYLSLNNGELCFNSPQLNTKDFIGLFDGLKKISSITYDTLKKVPNYNVYRKNEVPDRLNYKHNNNILQNSVVAPPRGGGPGGGTCLPITDHYKQ